MDSDLIEAHRFLVDQARIQITDQWTRVEGFRSKSFVSLAVSGTIAAFFGGTFAHVTIGYRVFLIVAFIATSIAAVALIWPVRFSHGIGPLSYQEWLSVPEATGEDLLGLAKSTSRDVAQSWTKNEGRIRTASWIFRGQCVALTAQLTAWLLILWVAH